MGEQSSVDLSAMMEELRKLQVCLEHLTDEVRRLNAARDVEVMEEQRKMYMRQFGV